MIGTFFGQLKSIFHPRRERIQASGCLVRSLCDVSRDRTVTIPSDQSINHASRSALHMFSHHKYSRAYCLESGFVPLQVEEWEKIITGGNLGRSEQPDSERVYNRTSA